jgi:DNA-binding Lrp family transcriptional regulator
MTHSLGTREGAVNGCASIVETRGVLDRAVPRAPEWRMAVKIDDTDRRIILLLQQDGRMSARDVARRLGGITDRAVRYRIDRLLSSGAIDVIAVVNNEVVGYPVLGDVMIELPQSRVRDTLAELADDELVCYLGADLERGAITIQIAARDEYEFHDWVSRRLRSLEGAALMKSTVVRQVTKGSDRWPPPQGGG